MKTSASPRPSGFSLVEVIVTIGVLGVLAAIAIPVLSGVFDRSEEAVAGDHVESLNRAVTNYSHNCWKIPTAADNSSTADELTVLRSIQWTFPAADVSGIKLGSPYFDPRYDPAPSSSSSDIRIRWNGKSFELLKRGTTGTGLSYRGKADYKSSPYSFPSGYRPAGP